MAIGLQINFTSQMPFLSNYQQLIFNVQKLPFLIILGENCLPHDCYSYQVIDKIFAKMMNFHCVGNLKFSHKLVTERHLVICLNFSHLHTTIAVGIQFTHLFTPSKSPPRDVEKNQKFPKNFCHPCKLIKSLKPSVVLLV